MFLATMIYERFGDTNLAHCWQSHIDVDDEDGDADDAADGYGHGDDDAGVGNDAGPP